MSEQHAALVAAVDLAIAGAWDKAHAACQKLEGDAMADWLHAVLHRIEGDEDNAKYWYQRSHRSPEAWPEPAEELRAIKAALAKPST